MRQYFLFEGLIDAAGCSLKQGMIEPKNESPWNPAEISDFYSTIEANQYFGLHPGDVIFFDQPVSWPWGDWKGERHGGTKNGVDFFSDSTREIRFSQWKSATWNDYLSRKDIDNLEVFFVVMSKWAAGILLLMLEEHMTWTASGKRRHHPQREKFILLCEKYEKIIQPEPQLF